MTKEEEQENENEAKEGEDRGPSFTSGHLFSASGKPFEEDRRRPRCVWAQGGGASDGVRFHDMLICDISVFYVHSFGFFSLFVPLFFPSSFVFEIGARSFLRRLACT